MSLIETIEICWLIPTAGTFIFLASLILQALRSGGIQPYRKLQISFPTLLVILLAAALVWPWTLLKARRLIRKNT